MADDPDYPGSSVVSEKTTEDLYPGSSPLYETLKPPSWRQRHPILSKAIEGATTSAGLAGIGRGMMAAAPLAAEVPPLAGGMEAVGGMLSQAPVISAAMSGLAGAGGEAVRQYGKPLLGKATEPAAVVTELATPFGAGKAARGVYEAALGTPSKMAEELAPLARKLGFKLEPSALRQTKGDLTSGASDVAKHNQDLANKLVTEKTGAQTDSITPEYIGKIHDELGKEYSKIYTKDNVFTLSPDVTKSIVEQLDRELSLQPAAASYSVKSVAKALLTPSEYKVVESLSNAGTPQNPEILKQIKDKIFGGQSITVTGDRLQRLRMELGNVLKSSDPAQRMAGHELYNTITEGVKSANPEVAARLAELGPKYRTVLTLDELAKQGGIQNGNISLEKLGQNLRSSDFKYTKGQSTHPLAELGQHGETFKIKGVHEYAPDKDMLGRAAGVVKGAGKAIPGVAAVDALRRGAPGQRAQTLLANRMRKPMTFPWAATLATPLDDALGSVGGND